MSYVSLVKTQKTYKGNIVVMIDGNYFAIREPDSGLSIASPFAGCLMSLTINPTQIDIRRVTTTISSSSFRLLDKDGIISALILGDASNLVGQEVRIFLGRSGVDMPFSDYFELPKTTITKCEHGDDSYVFNSSEKTERMAKPIYDYKSALGVDILAATTTWTMRDDISDFPTAGFLKVDDEFVSYSGKDLGNNRFTGVIRGELNSIPVEHDQYSDCVLVETVTDNPLNILIKILVSGGGGGTYDVLQSGLGLSESLIDIDEIEELRDNQFLDVEYTLSLYSIDSALKFIEDQILAPNNLRFTNSANSKITLALLDKAAFVEEDDIIDHDTITKFPKWSIDGVKVTNVIEVQWDFAEATGMYNERTIFIDSASVALYGKQTPLKFDFKGIKSTLDGLNLVEEFGDRLLARLSVPTPEISLNTQIDKSLLNVGDKAYVVSSKIPASDGTLDFASNLEIISRSINVTNGDVQFKLAFTSFTGIRSAFIAPSDLITSSVSQSRVNIALGRGDQYKVGMYMRLWDVANQVYLSDLPNKIVDIVQGPVETLLTEGGDELITEDGDALITEQSSTEDTIVFEDDWVTPIVPSLYKMRFADYDDAAESQKRYGFISDGGANFTIDNKPTYKVTY